MNLDSVATKLQLLVSQSKELLKARSAKQKALQEAAERRAIAHLFNSLYTYRKEFVPGKERLPGTAMLGINPRGGFAWMCPECNSIWHPYESSVFSGLQYPACCKTPQGHRLDEGIRSK